MSDANGAAVQPVPVHPPFPFVRLLYALGFGVLAWFVFWAVVIFGILQFTLVAINGTTHEELKSFTRRLIQYLWELLAYVTFTRDDQPFPFGPYPKAS